MENDEISKNVVLGIDSSTSGCTVIAIDVLHGSIVEKVSILYDNDLPQYGTRNGVHVGQDGSTVTQPPIMWFHGLEQAFDTLKSKLFDFSRVVAICGSAQQHGCVLWQRDASDRLKHLDPAVSLHEQLIGTFTLEEAPIWMDSSTSDQCELFRQAFGNDTSLADQTGSAAHERFTGPQLLKLIQTQTSRVSRAERVSLVSSAIASVLIGAYAPVDWGDASGTNLFDIHQFKWHPVAIDLLAHHLWKQTIESSNSTSMSHTAQSSDQQYIIHTDSNGDSSRSSISPSSENPSQIHASTQTQARNHIERLLGPVGPNSEIIDTSIHSYWRRRYGFSDNCKIVTFSGDNPSSVEALGLSTDGIIGISLGTSDTLICLTTKPTPDVNRHVFLSGTSTSQRPVYMHLICYKNGGAVRKRLGYARLHEIKKSDPQSCRSSPLDDTAAYEAFNKSLQSRNLDSKLIGMIAEYPEISPPIHDQGIFVQRDSHTPIQSCAINDIQTLSISDQIQIHTEGRFLSMKYRLQELGVEPTEIRVCGGATNSSAILDVLAQVFQTKVTVCNSTNAAALGAALCARRLVMNDTTTVDDKSWSIGPVYIPRERHKPYCATQEAIDRYQTFERNLVDI